LADWSAGSYELMAAEIESVATEVIDAVEPVENLKLLDLACGTGNATLVAARRGAHAVGFDGAARLLEIAESRASEDGLSIGWMEGDMHELPFAGESYDIVTSVFGVIFATDPGKTVAEIGRVLNHSGRFAISAWTNVGPLSEVASIWQAAVGEKLGIEPDTTGMEVWGDIGRVTELFAEHGLAAHCEEHSIPLEGKTPDNVVDEWRDSHPLWLATKPILGEDGYAATVEASRSKVAELNEDPSAFRMTSNYIIVSGSPV
jgi:SAM-dependent methyltransferase